MTEWGKCAGALSHAAAGDQRTAGDGGTVCGSSLARLDLTLAAGTYFVEVSDQFKDGTGGYSLLWQLP